MSETDREHLVTNIVGHLKDGVKSDMLQRAIQYWTNIDAGLGARIRTTLEGGRANGATEKSSEVTK